MWHWIPRFSTRLRHQNLVEIAFEVIIHNGYIANYFYTIFSNFNLTVRYSSTTLSSDYCLWIVTYTQTRNTISKFCVVAPLENEISQKNWWKPPLLKPNISIHHYVYVKYSNWVGMYSNTNLCRRYRRGRACRGRRRSLGNGLRKVKSFGLWLFFIFLDVGKTRLEGLHSCLPAK